MLTLRRNPNDSQVTSELGPIAPVDDPTVAIPVPTPSSYSGEDAGARAARLRQDRLREAKAAHPRRGGTRLIGAALLSLGLMLGVGAAGYAYGEARYEAGYAAGERSGEQSGAEQAADSSYTEGYNDGVLEGYDDGYSDGFDKGIASAPSDEEDATASRPKGERGADPAER